MKVSTTFTLLVVLVVGWLIAFSTSTGARAGTTTSISQFAGAWEGVYFSYPHPMGLTMTLTQTEEASVEGEVRFYPLRQDSRSVVRAPEGRFSVRGTYDPTLLTFTLEPGAWIERPRHGGKPFVLQGVFDPGQPALAGLHSSQRNDRLYFTLTRPDRGHLLTGPMLDATTKPARHLLAGLFGGPDEGTLVRWASKLTAEYPDVDPRRTELGRLYAMAVNLFEDEHFRAHFGKTFDQLSAGEREAVRTTFAKTSKISTSPRGSFRGMLQGQPNEELRQFNALGRAFSPTGTQGAPDVIHMVLAQRVIRAWRTTQLGRLAQMAPALDAFDELDRLTAAARTHLRTLWPSEQAVFQATLAESRSRLAVPVLTAIVNELVLDASGYDGAVALATWQRGRDQLISAVPADVLAALTTRVHLRLDEVLELLIATRIAALDALGTGLGAVEGGNRWMAELVREFGFAMNRPPIQAAVARLQARRPSDLEAARDGIARRISAQETAKGVDAVLRSMLAVTGDHRTDAGRALAQVARARNAAISREAALAYYTDWERQNLGPDDRILIPPRSEPVPPGKEEIRRALLRAFIDAGGRWVDPNTVTYGWAFMMGHFDYYVDIPGLRIEKDKKGEEKINKVDPYEHVYEARVRLHLRLRMSPEMERFFADSPQGALARGLLTLGALEEGSVEERFLLTHEGWKSDTFGKKLMMQNLSLLRPLWEK